MEAPYDTPPADRAAPAPAVRSLAPFVLRLASLVAIAFSAALLVDYLRPAPAFCGAGSGCESVRRSGYGWLGPVPVPLIGVAGYAAVLALSLSTRVLFRRTAWWAAAAGGVAGLAFLAVQAFVVHALCRLCAVVDLSALLAAGAAFTWRRGGLVDDPRWRWTWLALAVVAVAGPWAWASAVPAAESDVAVPDEIRALALPDKVTVVEFSDFECPFCRLAHPALEAALARANVPLHVIRKTMPLAGHPNARPASSAYLCAVDQGRGPAMADALFAAESLDPAACETIARGLGLDLAAYRTCVASADTEERIERDIAFVRRAGFRGLPTVWVGNEALLGARTEDEYTSAIRRAADGLGGR